MPLQATSGAASYDAFGGGVPVVNYIEEVFSTFLYTGTGSAQTITNNIDLSTKGGLVWIKNRSSQDFGNTRAHWLFDSARTAGNSLASNSSNAENTAFAGSIPFSTTGFSVNTGDANLNGTGTNPYTYASWTFRKQPKFFDIQTWTGSGANRTITHSLGSVPGSIWVKRTDTTGDWQVYHRSLANTQYLVLNSTAAAATGATRWNSTTPTSSVFSVGTDATVNASAGTYVAYLFAHDAGGFGLNGTDNVISCGDFTTDASGNATVNLGYEPQYILMKLNVNGAVNWVTYDIMRGWGLGNVAQLYPNITQAEDAYAGGPYFFPTATGFTLNGTLGLGNNQTNAYIAIRRGPMKVPTSGTSVFSPQVQTPSGSGSYVMAASSGFPIDWLPTKQKGIVNDWYQTSRLTNNYMSPSSSGAEGVYTYGFDLMQGVSAGWAANSTVSYAFRRAPSVFDVVCYKGTGSARTVSHSLGVVPELVFVKNRTVGYSWQVGVLSRTFAKVLSLDQNSAEGSYSNVFNNTDPTSSVFTVGTGPTTNGNTNEIVAYLFATCAGVSKVGSYTGTGTTLQIDCGFTAGARFVLIKRTDSTGDWYVWDTARGIISGNDPYLLISSTAAEVTSTDYIDTYNAGFELSSTAPAAINASAGTFIFLAIA